MGAPGRDPTIFLGPRRALGALRERFSILLGAVLGPTSVPMPFWRDPGAILARFSTPGTSKIELSPKRRAIFQKIALFRKIAKMVVQGLPGGGKMDPNIAPGATFKSDQRPPKSLWAAPGRGQEFILAPGGLPGPLLEASGEPPGGGSAPEGRPEGSREPFWSYFGSILDPPGAHF